MANSIILDIHGTPFKKTELSGGIATAQLTGVRNVWGYGSEAEWISPARLARLLRDAANGDANAYLTLAEEMEERDPHYASVLGTRKRAIGGLDVVVEAASDDAHDIKMADALRELIRLPEFYEMRDDLLDALGKGYSVIETDWDTSETPWMLRNRYEMRDGVYEQVDAYTWRDQRFFKFDKLTGRRLRMIDDSNSIDGLPLPQYRFIIHQPRLKTGLPIRSGIARLVAVAVMCKSYAITDWMAFAEVFGMPLRVGKYGPNATPEDIFTLVNALANIGTDAAAAIPESMKIEFEAPGNSTGGADLFKNLAEWLDKQISKAVLGQTASSEGTPGQLGGNDAQDEVRFDILKSDAKQLDNTINRDLVKAFIDLNFGAQKRYPTIVHRVIEAEDLTALVAAVKDLVPLGLGVEAATMRAKLGLPEPAKDAVLLQSAATAPPVLPSAQNHQCSCHACTALHSAMNRQQVLDPLDDIEKEALSEWQLQMQPITSPIVALAESVETYDDFIAALPSLLKIMDAKELTQQLAMAAFKARANGNGDEK